MAFQQQGNTVAIVGAVSAPAPVQALGFANTQPMDYLVQASAAGAYLAFGLTAAQATTNAVVPAGSPEQAIPVPSNYPLMLRLSPSQWFTAVTATGTVTVNVTPGAGDA